MMFFIGLVAVIAVAALWAVGIYNRLISLRNQVKNAWSQIDVQLQRRYDLIPNLVETVKGYMEHEKSTLNQVVEARSEAMKAREAIEKAGGPTDASIEKLVAAETALRSGIGNIFALAENYPQLRASETMAHLQEELRTTENKVSFARQSYNDQVLFYNTTQQEFPANLLAGAFGHHPADLFETSTPVAKEAVKVKF